MQRQREQNTLKFAARERADGLAQQRLGLDHAERAERCLARAGTQPQPERSSLADAGEQIADGRRRGRIQIYALRHVADAWPAELLLAAGVDELQTALKRHFTEQRAQQRRLTRAVGRSEEHTSELQSPCNLVCRLLLEK